MKNKYKKTNIPVDKNKKINLNENKGKKCPRCGGKDNLYRKRGPLCVLLDFPNISSNVTKRALMPAQLVGKTLKRSNQVALLEKDAEGHWNPCELHRVGKNMVKQTFYMDEEGRLPSDIEAVVVPLGGVASDVSVVPTGGEALEEMPSIEQDKPTQTNTGANTVNAENIHYVLSLEMNVNMTAKGHIAVPKKDIHYGKMMILR
eukprot:GHVR01023758.1.p2 GENE.GHVR01023758.1~~GHVR01023758.1.p2  ORF type:complete len:203 (+),score=34.31 GHVR01023758.1:686-1294(+)